MATRRRSEPECGRPAGPPSTPGRRAALRSACLVLAALGLVACGGIAGGGERAEAPAPVAPEAGLAVAGLLVRDDFTAGLARWRVEAVPGGRVEARNGALEIDVPAGCTVWLAEPLAGPVLIRYEATAVAGGGPNDRVSDLNCFWMADDARSPGDLFATARGGRFEEYDHLRCYYVGLGGNANTTSRFRRYLGEAGNRPLRPEHDLTAPEFLLQPNAAQQIEIIAAGGRIAYFRDGRRLFELEDSAPYTRGWFGFRTVNSHLRIRAFEVWRLADRPAAR